MRPGRSGSPRRAPLFEVWDLLGYCFDTPGSLVTPRALWSVGQDSQTIRGLYVLGGGAQPGLVTRNGFVAYSFQPGTNQSASATLGYALPVSRQLGNYPASFRYPRRIVYETVLERSNPLIAGVKMEIGMRDDPGTALASGNSYGLILMSVSTLNGGNWTLQWLPSAGGGVQTGADSGVTPFGLRHIKFEYYDTQTPSMNIYIDGVLKYQVPAAVLAAIALAVNEPLSLGVNSGDTVNTIGQIDYMYDTHFLVEAL